MTAKTAVARAKKDRVGVRLERFFYEHWPAVCNYLGSLALAVAGVVGVLLPSTNEPEPEPTPTPSEDGIDAASEAVGALTGAGLLTWILLILGAILVLVGLLGSLLRSESLEKLEKRAVTAETDLADHIDSIESVLRAMLVGLSSELSIFKDDSRASIYAYDADAFVRLARISKNPTLKSGGRASYPANQGVIGLAWNEGKASLTRLPDDRADWEARMTESGIPPEVARSLRMQCKSIVALRLDGPEPEHHPLAIVVYESEAKQGVNGGTVDATRTAHSWKTLTDAVSNMRETISVVARVKRLAEETRIASEKQPAE